MADKKENHKNYDNIFFNISLRLEGIAHRYTVSFL